MVESIHAGASGIEPDGAGFAFAEFGSVGIGDQWEGEAVDGLAGFFAGELRADGDVAPLVAAADLEFAVFRLVEVVEVVALEQHIGEFRVADAGFIVAAEARFDAFFGHHGIDREVFSDVAEEIEEADGADPRGIVDELGGVGERFVEVEDAGELLSDGGDIAIEHFFGQQLAFGFFPRWIADAAGCSTCESDRAMACVLESAERDERHEVADVEGVGGRIEACVESDWAVGETFGQLIERRAVSVKSSPL